MSSYTVSGPDLVPTGVAPNSMGATSPNPQMEQAQSVHNGGFNTNIATTRNTREGNPRAIGHYSGNEAELGIVQADPCFTRRGVYDATGTTSRAGVFSGWNGVDLTGIHNEMDYYNAFQYMGISLGAAYINAKMDPNSQQGVATAMSGTWSFPKHYGTKTIHVGDVVRMRLPPLDQTKLRMEMRQRQKGEDFPFPSKILATPEPVNPIDVIEFWRTSANSLIEENFTKDFRPNPAFDIRDNLFQLGASYTNRNSAQDTMTVYLKQLVNFIGVSYAMHLIDYGLVQPVTFSDARATNYLPVGSSNIARQALIASLRNVSITNPHANTLAFGANTVGATPPLTVPESNKLRLGRDDFKRFLMGFTGLVREDGGTTEDPLFSRMFHMRVLGYASNNARHSSIASQLTSNSLIAPSRVISLLPQYQSGSNSASDQYRQIQSTAVASFMRKSGEVLDFLYKNCAGRAMTNSPEGTLLTGVR